MKKRIVTLVVIVAVFALLLGAYFLVSNLTKEDESSNEETVQSITVTAQSVDDATALSYKNESSNSFAKNENLWSYDGDKDFLLSQTKFEELLSAATAVTATRDLTEEAQTDDSVYGFDNPTLSLSVSYVSGGKDELIFGSYNDSLSSYYLKYNGKIYLTSSDVVDSFDVELYDLLDTTSLETISEDTVKSYTINATTVTSDSDSEKYEALKSAYTSLDITGVADYKNAETYGFDGTQTKVTVEYTETTEVTAEDGSSSTSADVTHQYSFELATKNDSYYIRLPDDDLIYCVSGAEEFFK